MLNIAIPINVNREILNRGHYRKTKIIRIRKNRIKKTINNKTEDIAEMEKLKKMEDERDKIENKEKDRKEKNKRLVAYMEKTLKEEEEIKEKEVNIANLTCCGNVEKKEIKE